MFILKLFKNTMGSTRSPFCSPFEQRKAKVFKQQNTDLFGGVDVELTAGHPVDSGFRLVHLPAQFLGQVRWLIDKLFKARFSRLRPAGTGWWTGIRLRIRVGFLFMALLAAGLVGFVLSGIN